MKKVHVQDEYQEYTYTVSEPVGEHFDPAFNPDLTPKQMLELGVFGGSYFKGEHAEFPADWFASAKLSPDGSHDYHLNYFDVDASQSRQEWLRKGWIYEEDPRGWFQWYCRYYMGRRIPEEDARQIARWKAIRRHAAQIQKYCTPGDELCRPRQRQALLHWAYDSRKL